MKAVVKKVFRDIHSKEEYSAEQIIEVTDERFDEIVENLGSDFIDKVADDEQSATEPEKQSETDVEYPHHVGGGNYELSDGSRVKGKDAAIKAEVALSDN